MREVPKANGGQPYQKKATTDSGVDSRPSTKSTVIREAGFTPKQAERFQQLASHPEIVEAAKAEARDRLKFLHRGVKKFRQRRRHKYERAAMSEKCSK